MAFEPATEEAAISHASAYRRALVFLSFEGEALARYLSERQMNSHLLIATTLVTPMACE